VPDPAPAETPALAVIIHSAEEGSDWTTGVQRVAEAICGHDAVTECSVSVAVDDGKAGDLPFIAFVVASVPAASLASAAATVTPLVDPKRVSMLEVGIRRIIPYERTWDLGTPTPGERVVTVAVRKPGMTHDAFDRYWQDVHTGVALSYAVAPMGYTQYITRRSLLDGAFEPDGALVMHFRDAEQRRSRYEDHPDDAARGAADAEMFMDLTQTKGVLMRETFWR
jgi:hypothetical protein